MERAAATALPRDFGFEWTGITFQELKAGSIAIVVGSEAEGLTDAWLAPDVEPIHLPMLGIADSLNVSITAAVLLYEARRQRG